MQRLPSTLALSSWLGFIVASGVLIAVRHAGLPVPAAFAVPVLPATFAFVDIVLGVMGAVAACGLGGALVCLHGKRRDRRALGERLAMAALGILCAGIALVSLRGGEAGLSFGIGGGVWVALGASVLAILFDRLVVGEDGEDREDDGTDFEAGIKTIALGMARQVHLYPADPTGSGDLPSGRGRA